MLEKDHLLSKIRQVAARQWGHVTREQLLALGVAPATITRWASRGLLVRVFAGVYALGHAEQTAWARAAAAVLACGEGAVLSHASAAALWGLRAWPWVPEVTAPTHRARAGIRTHRSQTLAPLDVRRHHAIPVTSPARTIQDLQPRLSDRQLIRLINDARLADQPRLLPDGQLRLLIDRSPRIRRLIDPAQRPTRSGFEDDFLAFCHRHGLPTPQINTLVEGYEVDALFPAEKVIVELDSWRHHRSRRNFTTDRRRDLITAATGHLTIRIPDGGLTGPAAATTAAHLHQTLAHRRPA